MSRFAIQTPYLVVVLCLVTAILGGVALTRMPVDMFPRMNMPVVAVATFYAGMPPEQIENDITYHLERMFTLSSGIDHIESRSLSGVSIIKVYFASNVDPDAAASSIATLAMADLRDLPPGTLPPIVLKMDASSLPVCLVTLSGEGLSESSLKDLAQNVVRSQLASVPGSSVPQPFGGAWRQITLGLDPNKLEAYQLSPMDIVRSINDANLILPAGDVQIGGLDYDVYSNAQLHDVADLARTPIKIVGQSPVEVRDVGFTKDGAGLQYNIVRVDGQHAVYLPVLKQGGDSNTLAVVTGVRQVLERLADVPKSLRTRAVFDQSRFVRTAIETLLHEGGIGLLLTCAMILIFLGSLRATLAVCFSIPLSVLATFVALQLGGSSINTMILGGLALALSRLIDNSVVVLENIHRHLELGEPPALAAELGGREVALPVLAATLTTVVVFFPVTLLFGVSKYLFSAMALAVVLSLFASYAVAMTVVPLFCARFLNAGHGGDGASRFAKLNQRFNRGFTALLDRYERWLRPVLARPGRTLGGFGACFALSLLLFPVLGRSLFPATDAGQFVIALKAPSGTRLAATDQEVAKVEKLVRSTVLPADLEMIVSNIGVNPGFSALFSPNSAMHTAIVQVSLKPGHRIGSSEYIGRLKTLLASDLPELAAFFSSGSLVDAVVNMGLPAPIDVQISSNDLQADNRIALDLADKLRRAKGVAEVYIPQDLDYPSFKLDVDRVRAGELGLTEREVMTNVITVLNTNQMIEPIIWNDPSNGNEYYINVQYPDWQIREPKDLEAIPLHGKGVPASTRLGMVAKITRIDAPTELDHMQIRRVFDVYVRPSGRDLGAVAAEVDRVLAAETLPEGLRATIRGTVGAMHASFHSFAVGLCLSVLLLYLILVAQFRSFVDPWVILLALPPGISGVLLTLVSTGTTLNVMSLMGVVMLAGVVLSNSILIVDFARDLIERGSEVAPALTAACRARLRPILMTSLATVIGLLPMALALGEGSELYAPLARALVGGLTVSVLLTPFLVPAGFILCHPRRPSPAMSPRLRSPPAVTLEVPA
jgi:multidrug efflux pump subunit AcrB